MNCPMGTHQGPVLGPYDFDLLVFGAGSGGVAVAKEAAGFGRKVMIVDLPSSRGTKSNIIRKYFQQAALLGKAIQDSKKYGWKFMDNVSHDWSELVQSVQRQVENQSSELKRELQKSGVFYFEGQGQIVAPHTVQVTSVDGGRRSFTAQTLVIETGDRPLSLGIHGETEHCLTSEGLLSLPHDPGRTLVVGGSPEGLECAGFLNGLGFPVTVMPQPDLLPGFDQKMAQKIENHMYVAGVDFKYSCLLSKVECNEEYTKDGASGVTTPKPVSKGRLRVTIETKDGLSMQEEFNTVVVAVGRRPCSDAIGLDGVGVQCREDGRVVVNGWDQTLAEHVYCVGSVQSGPWGSEGSSEKAGKLLALRLYRGEPSLCDYMYVPSVVLTPLEYACCGLTEERAAIMFGENSIEVYHSYYWPLEWTLPSRNKNSCYVKVICHIPDHERVVGVHVLGPNSGDVLQGFVSAMRGGLTKQQLDATVGISPGTAQVLTSLTQTQRMSQAEVLRGNC